MSKETFEEFIQSMKERAIEEGIEISASFSIFQLENSCEYVWNHQQQKLDECNKTMSRQLTDIKMLHKELDTKDAEIERLRKSFTESVCNECKCPQNIEVNNELVKRNLELRANLSNERRIAQKRITDLEGKIPKE